jgi:hypothetical protein
LSKSNADGWQEALTLLTAAGLLREPIYKQLLKLAQGQPANPVKAILGSGLLDDLLFRAALRCNILLSRQELRREQAMIALHYCLRSRTNLDDALTELPFGP